MEYFISFNFYNHQVRQVLFPFYKGENKTQNG